MIVTPFKIDQHSTKPSDIIGSKNIDFTKVMAFDEQGHLLVLVTENGVSLPSGRVEWDDRDAFDAAHREAWETANVTLGTLIALNRVEMTTPEGNSFQTLTLSARIARIDPMREQQARRLFIEPKDFLKHYCNEVETLQHHTSMAVESIPEFQPNYLDSVKRELSQLTQVRA